MTSAMTGAPPLPGHAPRTLAEAVANGVRRLEAAGHDPDDSRRDAEILARAALAWDAADWLTHRQERATPQFLKALDTAIARRCKREPIAYITGTREFYGRRFCVTADVLIPRPETEVVIDEALAALRGHPSPRGATLQVADVGTGSGCLAVTMALERPEAAVLATDISAPALGIAAANSARWGVADRVELRQVSLVDDACRDLDLIVTNPPYVRDSEYPDLMPDVRDFEPRTALLGGSDGLDAIRALVPAAGRALKPGGWLVMEIGRGQAADVSAIVAGLTELALVRVAPDLAGIPRVIVACRRPL
jgi:release factor glutamine methyltransferase